jgi:copper homeostasis protein (lipoprotein)
MEALMRSVWLVALCVLTLVGCSREEPPQPTTQAPPRAEATPVADTTPGSIEPLPALFSGVLPCADCTGTRYDIDLREDNLYFLRLTFLGTAPERSYDDIGTWSLASDLRTLGLKGTRQSPLLFAITSANTLRRLDAEGQTIESELNYNVTRVTPYEALAPLVPLRGMYAPTKEGAVLEECATGLRMRLDGPNTAAIAQDFDKFRNGSSKPMLLAVEGSIHPLPEPADDVTAVLMTNATAKFWPGESCGARGVTHDLEGSRWVLVRVGERSITPAEGQAEPYIALQSATKQVVGHTGCNRLSGGYTITGEVLKLSEVATTRMACPAQEIENALLSGLEATAKWQLMDNQLVLLDGKGTPILQFESRNL